MDHPYRIPLWRTSRELMPDNAGSRVVLSSVGTKWNDVVVEQHHFPGGELADVMFKQHVIVVTVGHAITCEFKKEGRFQHVFKARGAISFFPSYQPFFLRLKVEKGTFANVLFLALDPAFVSRTAVGLELHSDHIELVEQHGGTDPTLHHIAMALQAESRPAMPLTRCMGRHYQQRSPSTCYANTARQCRNQKAGMVGCRAKSCCVLSNIFEISWTQT